MIGAEKRRDTAEAHPWDGRQKKTVSDYDSVYGMIASGPV